MPLSPPLALKKSTVKMSSLIPFYVYKLRFNNLLFPFLCSVFVDFFFNPPTTGKGSRETMESFWEAECCSYKDSNGFPPNYVCLT